MEPKVVSVRPSHIRPCSIVEGGRCGIAAGAVLLSGMQRLAVTANVLRTLDKHTPGLLLQLRLLRAVRLLALQLAFPLPCRREALKADVSPTPSRISRVKGLPAWTLSLEAMAARQILQGRAGPCVDPV